MSSLHRIKNGVWLSGFYSLMSRWSSPFLHSLFLDLTVSPCTSLSPLPSPSFLSFSVGSLSSQGSPTWTNRPLRSTEYLTSGNKNSSFSDPGYLFSHFFSVWYIYASIQSAYFQILGLNYMCDLHLPALLYVLCKPCKGRHTSPRDIWVFYSSMFFETHGVVSVILMALRAWHQCLNRVTLALTHCLG